MFIGYLKVNIFIPHSQSLKQKRQVVLGVKNRLRNKLNIAIAEKPSDKWQVSELSFVCVNYTKQHVCETMDKIEGFIRYHNDINILDTEKEVF